MEAIQKENMSAIAPLFDGWNKTMVLSCLQGCMGRAWADCAGNPSSAQIVVGDFCFFAGEPSETLAAHIPADSSSGSLLMIPRTVDWADTILRLYPDSQQFLRYSVRKAPEGFDRTLLESYIRRLPPGFQLQRVDEALYRQAGKADWSRDLCAQFPSYADYQALGLGVMALHNGLPVSGASSYSVYRGGIEIEIDTREEYRRKGLALACAAQLILDCLDRGLEPCWDAHDLRSVALAERLGYRPDGAYLTYLTPGCT